MPTSVWSSFCLWYFKCGMENRLLKVSFVKVQSNGILVLGKNDFDHVQNLKAVLDILKENDWRLKMKKCVFMQPEVIYLGFKINKEKYFLLLYSGE